MVRRASEQPVSHVGDGAMQLRALEEVFPGLRPQEVGAKSLLALLEAEPRVRRLHVVDLGDRARAIPAGGVRRYIVYFLGANIDNPAIAKRLQMLISGL